MTEDDPIYELPEFVQHETSFFSDPHELLDQRLFDSGELKPWVADDLEGMLYDFLGSLGLQHIDAWLHIWLAGSGVSFIWNEKESDLDCLLGINWVQFRQFNDDFRGLSDQDISSWMNDQFYTGLNKDYWNGFELTFYVNPQATDIRSINPYAAWDVTCGTWTVVPDITKQEDIRTEYPSNWALVSESDYSRAMVAASRYTEALRRLQEATNPAHRTNAEVYVKNALSLGASLYDEIHHGRRDSFSESGGGYKSFGNWRWQMAKSSGTKQVLEQMKAYHQGLEAKKYTGTFGVELPSPSSLVVRAALAHR